METGLPVLDDLVIPWLGKFVIALLIFLIGKWVADHISKILLRLMLKSGLDDTLVRFLHKLAYVFMLILVALPAVEAAGISIASLLALLGAAGLAVGLALKDSLSNLAAGVMIIVFRPFRVGDGITASGSSGTVEDIGMFSTTLTTPDNQRVILPNAAIISGTIINATTFATRRVDLLIGIGFNDNIGTAKKIIAEVLAAENRILPEPASSIGVETIGENSVLLFVRAWVRTPDYGLVRADLLERIKDNLATAGIVIPYRQQTIHLHQVSATQPD
ncbi:MAG: mechanosensitive ion channel domain-containing protein [Pseudomonadota bacterium]